MKIAIPVLAACMSHAVRAEDLTWDTITNDGSAITYAGGTWNRTVTNTVWNTGTNNVAWSNSPVKNALIPGDAGSVPTITIGADALTVGKITVGGAGSTTVFAGSYANLTANEIAIQTSGAGKLALTTVGTLANVAAFSIANGATLFLGGTTVNSSVSVQGNGNNENRGALRLDSGGTLQGSITLLGDATFGSTSSCVIQSAINGGFAFNQAPVSGGTVRFAGDNSFTGGSTIATGTVQAGHNRAFGSGTLRLNGGTLSSDSTTARTFANPATLGGAVTLGNATNSGKLTFSGAVQSTAASATVTANSNVEFADLRSIGTLSLGGSGPLVLGKFTALTSNAVLAGGSTTLAPGGTTIDTNGYNAGVSTSLTGAAGMTKTGAGTLTLNGATSSFTGTLQVAAGTLKLASARVAPLPANLDIMTAGDSITYGAGAAGGYRAPLYNLLQPIAPGMRFVGESTLNAGTLPAGQQNHAGHSSYSTLDIFRNLDGLDTTTFTTYGGADRNPNGGYWLTGGDGTNGTPNRTPLFPDVVLLLVGTNDVYRSDTGVTDKKASYTNLLTKLTTLRPTAEIFMAKITPHSSGSATEIQRVNNYNAIVTEVHGEFKAAGKKVTLVDLNSGFPSGGFADSLHPNATGYAWMAGKWRDALLGTLGVEAPLDFRNASSLNVAPNATLTGGAFVNQLTVQGTLAPGDGIGSITATSASISGTYACEISGGTADLLAVQGDLDLSNATLAFSTVQAPTAPVIPIATYTGNLSGAFAAATGMPAGYQLVHEQSNKRFVLAAKSPYAAWRSASGLADDYFATTQDADGDGVDDIVEFATAGNPSSAQDRGTLSSGLSEVSGQTGLTLTFATRAGATFAAAPDNALTATIDSITYRVECTEDLSQWNGALSEITPPDDLPAAAPGYEYHRFKATGSPATKAKTFLRLQVTGR